VIDEEPRKVEETSEPGDDEDDMEGLDIEHDSRE
jgi:hypothetical protein